MRNDNAKTANRNKNREHKKAASNGTRKGFSPERQSREKISRQKLTSQALAQKVQDAREQNVQELPEDVLIGRNAVTEALRAGRGINKILLADGDREGQVSEIVALAKERGIVLQFVDRGKIESVASGLRHQGVLAYVAPVAYAELEDPHNLGALLRTADATGVHGVLIPKRRSVPLTATVAKTSAGAVEYVPVARIGNISQTLKILKEKGFWVAGADMDGKQNYYEADLTGPLVLVVGSEGKGMGRLTKEQCDFIVKMPMVGKINSLNASVAGSILMYESMRQRLAAKN